MFSRYIELKKQRQKLQMANPMNDFIIKARQILWFPCTLGLTSKAFAEGNIAYANLVAKISDGNEDPIDERFIRQRQILNDHSKFMNDIDNSMGARNIQNYIIGSV